MSVAAIQHEMLDLPASERARLIDILWESFPSSGTKTREAAWAKESERRIDAVEAGKPSAQGAAEVHSELRKDLRE